MRTTVVSSITGISVAICVVVSGCGKTDSGKEAEAPKPKMETTKPTSTPAKEVIAEKQEYEEVNPSELVFEMKDYNYRGEVVAGGVKPTGGHIGGFLCEGTTLQLSSDKFEDGFILTKEYGKIKVTFGNSLYGKSFSVCLTPKQKKALSPLKKTQ